MIQYFVILDFFKGFEIFLSKYLKMKMEKKRNMFVHAYGESMFITTFSPYIKENGSLLKIRSIDLACDRLLCKVYYVQGFAIIID